MEVSCLFNDRTSPTARLVLTITMMVLLPIACGLQNTQGVLAQSVERATPGQKVVCLIPTGWVGVSIT